MGPGETLDTSKRNGKALAGEMRVPGLETQYGAHGEKVQKVQNPSVSQLASCQFSLTCPGCCHDVLNHVKFINTILSSIKFCNHKGQ